MSSLPVRHKLASLNPFRREVEEPFTAFSVLYIYMHIKSCILSNVPFVLSKIRITDRETEGKDERKKNGRE